MNTFPKQSSTAAGSWGCQDRHVNWKVHRLAHVLRDWPSVKLRGVLGAGNVVKFRPAALV